MALDKQIAAGLAAALGCLTVTALGPSTPAAAAAPGSEGQIAYVAPNPDHGNSLEIYTITRDGTSRANFSAHPERDQDPAWSPDGTRIAFASARDEVHMDIWVAAADGSGLTNLTPLPDSTDSGQAGTEPAWSPDGTRIAYSYQGDIWVMRATTGAGKRNLTDDPSLPAAGQSPAWSPDGTTIAYVRNGDIWVMGAGGANKRQLTFTGGSAAEKNPDWSPDGLRLVYERSGQVWTMNRNGTQQTAVAAGPDQGGTGPAWSPEGDWVVFSSSGYTAPNGPDLFVARPDGSAVRRILNTGAASDILPSWQPLTDGSARSTYLTLVPSVTDTRIAVKGELFDANPGQVVQVILQRSDGVVFRTVRQLNATLSPYGDYATGFGNPADTTSCRLVARYAGDGDSLPASRSVVFDC